MKLFDNRFERSWTVIFALLYLVVMLPLPFFFSERYIASIAGLPLFFIGWAVHTAITFLAIVIFAHACMKRPEYQNFRQGEE